MSRIRKHRRTKSEAREAPPKKSMSKQMIMTIILGSVMVLSVFGIMFSSYNSGNEKERYGDHVFKRSTNGWVTEINGQKAEFTYLPKDLENMNISTAAADKLRGAKVVYITFNPHARHVDKFELMRFELGNTLVQVAGMYALAAISENNSAYTQPIVTCENATAALPVISIMEGNETDARVEGECIILESDDYSTRALKDKFLYDLLEIKNEQK
jgi:hypothetical protein